MYHSITRIHHKHEHMHEGGRGGGGAIDVILSGTNSQNYSHGVSERRENRELTL